MTTTKVQTVRALGQGDTLTAHRVWSEGTRYPSPDLLSAAAGLVPADRSSSQSGAEGPSFFLSVAPGAVMLRAKDLAKSERTIERQAAAPMLKRLSDFDVRPTPRGRVSEWSRQSRANMTKRLATLDYRPLIGSGLLCMVTLTYPGEWESVAPNGAAVKAHMKALRKRWERRFGSQLLAVWKLEYQRRGAPHVHFLVAIPPLPLADFTAWLGASWAQVVDHPDPVHRMRHERAGTAVDFARGLKMTDPKRLAVYFLKHSAKTGDDKEYQHIVPEAHAENGGPGRFWGVWGLRPAVVVVQVTPRDFIAARRLLRRYTDARFFRGGRMAGGFVLVNDGASFLAQVGRALTL